jgi:penicillin amidase
MTTPTLSLATPRSHTRVTRALKTLLGLFLLSTVAVGVYLYSVAREALPQLDGQVKVPGLSAPVKVTRDAHGVPTIEAANLPDIFFAQGYIMAQDRLWQMDIMRRFAAGELSEILGPDLLAHDREQRILGLRAAARQSLELYSPRDRAFLDAYARGVNAYIQERSHRLPVEFRLLRYRPAPWTAEDTALMGARMVQNLNHGLYLSALEKEKLLARLGPELTADLLVNSSWHDRAPSKAPVRLDQTDQDDDSDSNQDDNVTRSRPYAALALAARTAAERSSTVAGILDGIWSHNGVIPSEAVLHAERGISRTLQLLSSKNPELAIPRPGSNNWVISGAHTVSGKPLLSNDMHLNHQMPNLWYEVHLRSADFDVAGLSLPGVPFVIVGHNQRIGWGFTNLGPTVEDLFIETLNDKGQYQTPQGWRDLDHRREVIHVKNERDVVLDVPITRHGPIITELIPGEKRPLALRWTLYDGAHNPFFDVDSAQNWDQFLKAISLFEAPAQNVVYADVDGHIGYHATGHVPVRASGDGSLPVNGSDNAHEWTGYVPFEKLPNILDPAWGILATANGRVTPDDYLYSLSVEWDAPWRTERIYRVLESGKKFAPADMLALQTDVYSAFDRFCAERFVYALDHAQNLSPRARQARDLMRDWNGMMSTDSAAALVEVQSRSELARLLLQSKLSATANSSAPVSPADYKWSMASVWLENILLKQPKRWLPERFPDFDAVMVAAVNAAVDTPQLPSKLTDWRLGSAFPLTIQNPVLGKFPLISRWTGPGRVEQSGDGFTVKQAAGALGPSQRLTIDFSNFDQTTLNTVTGQGGNFLSPYYMDQWKAWYEGFTFPLAFSAEAVEKSKSHLLTLEPSR